MTIYKLKRKYDDGMQVHLPGSLINFSGKVPAPKSAIEMTDDQVAQHNAVIDEQLDAVEAAKLAALTKQVTAQVMSDLRKVESAEIVAVIEETAELEEASADAIVIKAGKQKALA